MHTSSKRELLDARKRLQSKVVKEFMSAPSSKGVSVKQYALVLQRLTIGSFVHHWKTRKALKTIHKELLTVAIEMLAELDAESSAEFSFYHTAKQKISHQLE